MTFLAEFITIGSGCAALVAFAKSGLRGRIFAGVLAMILVFIVWQYVARPYRKMLRGVPKIAAMINQACFHPDLIVSFERTGGILAGMLSKHIEVQQILILPRAVRSRKQEGLGEPKTEMAPEVSIQEDSWSDKNVLVVMFT